MISTGFKLFFATCMAALAAAIAYGYSTGGAGLGPLTAGFKGAVGEHVGYVALLVLALVLAGLAGMSVAYRDADAEAAASYLGADLAPAGQVPVPASMWPILAAFGTGAIAIGLVLSPAIFVAGIALVTVSVIEWVISAWSDRATGDAAANRTLRRELMRGYEVPALAVIGFGVIVLALSRVLLTVSKVGSTFVAMVLGLVIFGGAILLVLRPKVSRNLATALVLVCGVGLLGAGIVSAVNGEREFEHHESEGEEGEEAVTEEPASDGGATDGASTESEAPAADEGAEG